MDYMMGVIKSDRILPLQFASTDLPSLPLHTKESKRAIDYRFYYSRSVAYAAAS